MERHESSPGERVLPLQRCICGEDISRLSDAELVAIILHTGIRGRDVISVATELLKARHGLAGLASSGLREMSGCCGVGLIKAVRMKAAFELGRRVITTPPDRKRVDSPGSVWRLLLPEMAGLKQEEFRVLVVNNKNCLLKKTIISLGTISEAIVHPREVFREAIRESGSGIIIAHNHPSGSLDPSREDVLATKRICDAGKIIGIPLLDHVIITDGGYLSLKEQGYI